MNKWKFQNFGEIKGTNHFSYLDEKNLYVINKSKGNSNKIFLIPKDTEKVRLINSFSNAHLKLFHYNLSDDSYVILINPFINGSLHSNGYKLMKYRNKTLLDSTGLNQNVFNSSFKYDNIYFITKNKRSQNLLYKINTSNFRKDSIYKKNLNISAYYVNNESNIWVLGEENDKTVLYNYKNNNWIRIKVFSDNFKNDISKLNVYKNHISILLYKTNRKILGGIGGSEYSLIISSDKGGNWGEIDLPINYYVKPNTFYRNEKFIAYSGLGRVTYLDLSNGSE